MARKRLRKTEPTPEPAPIQSKAHRPREPEHTATFWRNTYELERKTREALARQLHQEREVVKRLEAEIERHTNRETSTNDETRVVSRPVRKRVRVKHQPT